MAVGSSGTIATLAEMAALRATGTRPRSVSNLVLTTEQLDDAREGAGRRRPTPKARAELPGLDAGRADIILAGAVILEQVVHELDLAELIVSDYALREGVLLDTWRRRHGGSLHHLSDLRRQSVLDLGELMDEDPPHSAQVARLALELFDATRERHGLGDDAREILEAAALLCNVGHVPVPRPAPQAQLLRDPRHRPARRLQRRRGGAHRARGPLPPQVGAEGRGTPSSPRSTTTPSARSRVLAGLLRVATGLDRNHAARVQSVSVKDKGDRLVVKVTPVPGEDIPSSSTPPRRARAARQRRSTCRPRSARPDLAQASDRRRRCGWPSRRRRRPSAASAAM